MGHWSDHLPPGMLDWDDPHPTAGGLQIGDQNFPWEDFDYVKDLQAKLEKAERERRRAEKELAAAKAQVKKLTPSPQTSRLENLKRKTAETKTASRWIWSRKEKQYAWHQWDPARGMFFDTGARLTGTGIAYPDGWIFPKGYKPPSRPGE
jgi:hypothetical protein